MYTSEKLPQAFKQLFPEEEDQIKIIEILSMRLARLETALKLRNAPSIINYTDQVKDELLMLGFNDMAQIVMLINDDPLERGLADEFERKFDFWKSHTVHEMEENIRKSKAA